MPVYLDHNATTPLNEQVLEAMMPYMTGLYGNPSSVHRYGRITRDALEQARTQVANLVGAQPKEVVFTSGGTEANNLAIRGGMAQSPQSGLAISEIEHASVIAPARLSAQHGSALAMIPVSSQGLVSNEALLNSMTEATRLVSIMAANNETGVLQNIASLAEAAKKMKSDVLFHTDASQISGKMPINFAELNLDLMSLSSHKLYGPLGAGALVVNSHVDLAPLIVGGGQEKGRRSGTENLLALVGFGAAAELATQQMQQRQKHVQSLQTQLVSQLVEMAGITVFSLNVQRLPNTVMFAVQGIDGEMLLMQLDRKGFAVSSGSACDSGKTDPSHVLVAMDVTPQTAKGAIRVSFGEQNTNEDVLQLIDALEEIKQQFS